MTSLESLRQLFESYLKNKNQFEGHEKLYDPIVYTLSQGGKRIRPLLTLLGYSLYDNDVKKTLPAALCVEYFHNFTLIHDDIMDDAALRRGLPSVPRKYGLNTGILSGDVLMVLAYQELQSLSSPSIVTQSLKLFSSTAKLVCEGQQRDMDFENASEITLDQYIQMIKEKTAVLMGCALQLGAIVAGASLDYQMMLYNFGIQSGIAFQIQDDILDLYGDQQKVGKCIGGDIIQNKKTCLYILAMCYGGSHERQRLQDIYGGNHLNDDEKIKTVSGIFETIGVLDYANNLKADYLKAAWTSLEKSGGNSKVRAAIKKLAESLIMRDS